MWRNIMRSTKVKKVTILHYDIDIIQTLGLMLELFSFLW
jgi:hypothetical protein